MFSLQFLHVTQSKPILVIAVQKGDYEMAQVALFFGANVNQQMVDSGDASLHYAIRNQDVDMVRILVEHGADENAQNMIQETPIDRATQEIRRVMKNAIQKRSIRRNFLRIIWMSLLFLLISVLFGGFSHLGSQPQAVSEQSRPVRPVTNTTLGHDFLRGSWGGLKGKKETFKYLVPPGTEHVYFVANDTGASGLNIGGGSCGATLHWEKGDSIAIVKAWVNGKVGGKNKAEWTVHAVVPSAFYI